MLTILVKTRETIEIKFKESVNIIGKYFLEPNCIKTQEHCAFHLTMYWVITDQILEHNEKP